MCRRISLPFNASNAQVKQEKKSSNKWNCVVCGEKQSIRKVFAQGSMAKDVRGFVQRFNMSRQFEDGLLPDSPVLCLEESDGNRKRTDWSDYVDDDDEGKCSGKLEFADGDGELEPLIVTEMSKVKGIGSKFSIRNDTPSNCLKRIAGKRVRGYDETGV